MFGLFWRCVLLVVRKLFLSTKTSLFLFSCREIVRMDWFTRLFCNLIIKTYEFDKSLPLITSENLGLICLLTACVLGLCLGIATIFSNLDWTWLNFIESSISGEGLWLKYSCFSNKNYHTLLTCSSFDSIYYTYALYL